MERLLARTKPVSARIAALTAIVAAVALPQAVHAIGAWSGSGNALGVALLPMHLAVFLVGLYAGAAAGLTVGAVSPMLSFVLSGMPAYAAMPFMCLELGVYGLVCGALSEARIPVVGKVLLAQIGGRVVKYLCLLAAFSWFGGQTAPMAVWTATLQGVPGIIIQLAMIPLIMNVYRKFAK